MSACVHVYLYWHDDSRVSHLYVDSLGIKFYRESLALATGQVFYSFE